MFLNSKMIDTDAMIKFFKEVVNDNYWQFDIIFIPFWTITLFHSLKCNLIKSVLPSLLDAMPVKCLMICL